MQISCQRAIEIMRSQLTGREKEGAVAYVADKPVSAGTSLKFARLKIQAPWDAWLFFVDRDPRANWGHSCRYLMIGCAGGEIRSIEAQFPPFPESRSLGWRLAYKAPSVPDSLLPALN